MSASDNVYKKMCEELPYLNATPKKMADGSVKIYRRVQIQQGKGVPRIAIKAEWGTKAFIDEYHLAIEELTSGTLRSVKDTPISARRIPAGDPRATLGWLYESYLKSPQFNRLAPSTQQQKKRRLRKLMEDNRFVEWEKIRRSTVEEKLIERQGQAAAKTTEAGKNLCRRNGDEAYNSLRKDLSAIFKWAIKSKLAGDDFQNPCAGIEKLTPPKGVEVGQRAWKDHEVEQFLDHWPIGTVQHLYMQILLSFGPRISDAVKLGKDSLVEPSGDRPWSIRFKAEKTGVTIEVLLTEAVAEALAACPSPNNEFLFTAHGKPFSTSKSLGNWFDKAVKSAGLPKGLSSHGVRKTCATKMAEHSTEYQMMAVFGWQNANEARPYIQAANRLKQAAVAMKQEQNIQLSSGAISNYLRKAS